MLETIAFVTTIVCTPSTPPTGWEWEIEPREIEVENLEFVELGDTGTLLTNWSDDRFAARFVQNKSGDDVRAEQNGRGNAYMLVVETPDGTVEHASNSSMGTPSQNVHQWLGKRIDATQVSTLGLLRRTEEGTRLISEEAIAQGRSEGINLMPLAVVGESFYFDLPGLEGGQIDTGEYRGKFVLIDNWATWCGPCMAKMPELRELNDTWKSKDLQVIGIDWDRDIEKGKKAIEREEQTWPQVNPYQAAPDHYELWNKACGIDALPYLVLLDKKGRVMAAGRPHHVLEMAEKALSRQLLPPPSTVDPTKMPGFTSEIIQGMTAAEIRKALVEVSQSRKHARGNRQLQQSLTNQFNMLMDGLKSKSSSN